MIANCFPSRITFSKFGSTSPTYLRGIFLPSFRSLICLWQTSLAQNCNQIMRVEQSMMGSNCDGIMQSICWCLLACYYLWRHSCTVLSMTNWFFWSLRRTTQIHPFSDSLYYLWNSSSDYQQRSMRSYLYKHTDGNQIHLQVLQR